MTHSYVPWLIYISLNFVDAPKFCPWDLQLVPGNNVGLMINPIRILYSIVDNMAQNLENISKTLSTYQNAAHGIYDRMLPMGFTSSAIE